MSNGKTTQSRSITDLFLSEDLRKVSVEPIVELPVDSIQPNPYQVRQEFPEESIRELAESIKQNGLLHPIIVREQTPVHSSALEGVSEQKSTIYELIVGERRLKAHKLLGKETILAVVREVDDKKLRLLALVENLQREDLSTLGRVNGFCAFMSESGLKVEEAAIALGIKRRWGFVHARIGRADMKLKEIIAKNNLDMNSADKFLTLAERVKKEGSQEVKKSFERDSELPLDREAVESLYNRYFGTSIPAPVHSNALKEPEGSETPIKTQKRKKEMAFWEIIKEIEESPVKFAHSGNQEQEKLKNQLVKKAEKFFKDIGAKKFEVRF